MSHTVSHARQFHLQLLMFALLLLSNSFHFPSQNDQHILLAFKWHRNKFQCENYQYAINRCRCSIKYADYEYFSGKFEEYNVHSGCISIVYTDFANRCGLKGNFAIVRPYAVDWKSGYPKNSTQKTIILFLLINFSHYTYLEIHTSVTVSLVGLPQVHTTVTYIHSQQNKFFQ